LNEISSDVTPNLEITNTGRHAMLNIQEFFVGLFLRLVVVAKRLWGKISPKIGDSRGDVPGWVMITLMSAVLVAALLAIAGPRLQDLFNQAIDRVSGLG